MKLNLCGKLDSSLVNGEGIRTVIFGSGCSFRCQGCQNEFFQQPNCGTDFTIDEVKDIIYKNSECNKKRVTFSGGDPFFQAEAFAELAKQLKKEGFNIWCYTGYTIEDILSSPNKGFVELLENIDVLVDGPFDITKVENSKKYTGSSNQRIIDVRNYLLNLNT